MLATASAVLEYGVDVEVHSQSLIRLDRTIERDPLTSRAILILGTLQRAMRWCPAGRYEFQAEALDS